MAKLEALVAEFIGTFTLIFIGVGAIATDFVIHKGSTDLLAIALAHGLALVVMISATAAVSGGHLNPAVTFGAWVGGKIKTLAAAEYIIVQCLGAIAAALLVCRIFPVNVLSDLSVGGGVPALTSFRNGKPFITPGLGVLLEAVLTFFLVFVVFGTAIDQRAPKLGGLFIGLTVTMGILFAGPLTGAALNPARYMGPAVASLSFNDCWVYWAGPMLGGGTAGVVYRFVMEAGVKK
jgi:aquaporin TIP